MKQSTFSPYLRFLFVVFVLSGILMISFSFIPFEVWSQTLNAMTRDGKLESFTFARFQVLSTFMRLSGFCLILCFTAILTRPQKAIVIIESGRSLFKRFRESIRKDAKIFFIENLPGLRNRKENFVILLLVFMAFVVRLANLFMPMDHDEAYNYNAFASYPLWHVLSDYHVPNNHVLLTIMVNILTRLLGNHLWVIRMPTFIIGVCMVPAGYWLARRLYDKESAVLSAIFIAFFPVLVVYSVLARGYAIISLLTLLTFLVGDYVRNKRNFFAWIILIVLSALGFYAVPVMLLPFGALYIWLFLSCIFSDIASYRSKMEFLMFYLAGGVSTALLTIFLYSPILLNSSNRLFGNQFVAPVSWDEYPSAILFRMKNTWADWTNPVPGLLIILGVAGVILGIILHGRINRHKVPLQVAFAIWILIFVVIRRPDMETRMWTFLAAPLLIWSAGGLVGSLKRFLASFLQDWQVNKILSNVVLTVSLIFTVSILPTIPARWQARGSVENTVIYLKDHLRDGDLVWMSPVFVPQTRYYFDLYDIPLSYLRQPARFERAFVLVRSVDGSAAAGDTLEVAAPKNEQGLPAIDVASAKILLQFEDLTLYECYPSP